jgi:serine/threonine protein kinase
MGVVFHAEDTLLQRPVALKALLPGLAVGGLGRQRFLREARAAAAVEHEHVVAIYHVGEVGGVPFLAMPLLKGESLAERLRREGRLSVAEVLRLGREIAVGLAAAHQKGLIHRDIKPANVWLEGEPSATGEGATASRCPASATGGGAPTPVANPDYSW